MINIDWFSYLLDIVIVRGCLEVCCLFGVFWCEVFEKLLVDEIFYYVILVGSVVIELFDQLLQWFEVGMIFMVVDGSLYVLYDGSSKVFVLIIKCSFVNIMVGENNGLGEKLDMLCG